MVHNSWRMPFTSTILPVYYGKIDRKLYGHWDLMVVPTAHNTSYFSNYLSRQTAVPLLVPEWQGL